MNLFRTVISAIVLTICVQSGFGQAGLKLGGFILPQYTLMKNEFEQGLPQDSFKYKMSFGMAAGVAFGYNISDHWGFRLNVLYSAQGQSHTAKNGTGAEIDYTRRLTYLKAPVMIGFNTNTEYNKVIFSIYGGFQAGLLLNAKHFNNDETYTPDELLFYGVTDYPTTKDQYAFLDYGPVADVGIDIKLTYNLMANLHLRADMSLVDAEDKTARYKYTKNGNTSEVLIYDANRPETTNINGGILMGFTYTFTRY